MNNLSDVMNAFAKVVGFRREDSDRYVCKAPVTVDGDLIKEIRNHTGDNGRRRFASNGQEYIVQSAKVESCEGRIQSDWIRVYEVSGKVQFGVAWAHCYHDRGGVWKACATYFNA